jgi:predicted nucleic acid-binding protein
MVVFDSSVIVDDLRSRKHADRIAGIADLIRTSSVVLAELWRGANASDEANFLRELERQFPILTPTEKNWLDSGRILARMHAASGFDGQKLRDLHCDVLIALTARNYGARLITSNRADFELIRRYLDFKLEVW